MTKYNGPIVTLSKGLHGYDMVKSISFFPQESEFEEKAENPTLAVVINPYEWSSHLNAPENSCNSLVGVAEAAEMMMHLPSLTQSSSGFWAHNPYARPW